MSTPKTSNRTMIVVLLLLLLLAILFSLTRCARGESVAEEAVPPAVSVGATTAPAMAPSPAVEPEALTLATLEVAPQVAAGAAVRVVWTGPNNAGDYITIVRPEAAAAVYANYTDTRRGSPLEVLAPMEAGAWEVRYVTVRSKTVLGRAALNVRPVEATLSGPQEAVLGTTIAVAWTGPNNAGDYLTVVAAGAPDAHYGSYAETKAGSPVTLTVPVEAGAAEIRYVAAQGRTVLARRTVKITTPEMALSAASEVIAGAGFDVTWSGPRNKGDYLTVVPKGTPDGRYASYADAAKGSPVKLTAPIEAGEAEVRYMTGTGARVLARQAIRVVPAVVTMDAPKTVVAGAALEVRWSGPNNRGDYITLVPKTTPDGQYGNYADAARGNPLKIAVPKNAGVAELRYMSGQGAKVLARRTVEIVAAN